MSQLPTDYYIEQKEHLSPFTYDQVVEALHIHLEQEHNTSFNIEVVEITSELDYSKYTIAFIDKTYRGNNKPTFEEEMSFSYKEIQKLLK